MSADSKHANEKTPMNSSAAFFAFSNECECNFIQRRDELIRSSVVTDILFAHESDLLSDEMKAAEMQRNSCELLRGINMNKHFPWIPGLLESLPLSISKPMMPSGLIDMLGLFDVSPKFTTYKMTYLLNVDHQRVRTELVAIMYPKSSSDSQGPFMRPTGKKSFYHSVLDNPALPASENQLLRLEQEGALLVLAGAGPPAKSLTIISYHLLTNPSILSKLHSELRTIPAQILWAKLEPVSKTTKWLLEKNLDFMPLPTIRILTAKNTRIIAVRVIGV